MARAVITYDKDLPEIPDRDSSLPPTAYLRNGIIRLTNP